MKQIKLLFFTLLFSVCVVGQTNQPDSLVNLLSNGNLPADEQIPICKKLCVHYGHSDLSQLLPYCHKGLMLSKEENDLQSLSFFNEMIGFYHESSFQYDSASIYYNKALDLALQEQNIARESQVYMSLGAMYFMQNQYASALDYYMKAEKISSTLENKATHIYILGNIGILHQKMGNFDLAISFLEQALEVAETTPVPRFKINPTYHLGIIYRKKGDLDKAMQYASKVLNLSRDSKEKTDESNALQSIANIYLSKTPPDCERAMLYADSGLYVAREAGYPYTISTALCVKSNIHKERKQWALCEDAAVQAYEADSLNTGSDVYPNILKNIALANIYLGNKEKADLFFNRFHDYMLQSADKNLHSSILDMQIKYETEKKEIQIASLQQEKQYYTWLGIVGILLAASLGLVLAQNIRNTRKEKTLIAIRSVMDGEMKERTRLAQDLHDRLSGNLSAVKMELLHARSPLEVSDKLDGCIDEVRRVAHNLMPASLQHGVQAALEDFSAQLPNVRLHVFGAQHRFEERAEFVIYCCANELINNSIKHSGAKNINLQLVQDYKYITLTVQDDGEGYDEKSIVKGLGLKSITDRVASCNGKIDIVSSPGQGTETTIELKIKVRQ